MNRNINVILCAFLIAVFFASASALVHAVPTTPSVSASAAGSSQIDVSWSNVGVPGAMPITYYLIRADLNSNRYVGSSTSFSDTGLSASTAYSYAVAACDGVTCGPWSGYVSATTKSACTPSTCASLGKACSDWSDGCGGTLSCGTCGSGYTCSSGICFPAALPPAWPDLKAESISFSPVNPKAGDTVTVTATFKNVGNAAVTEVFSYGFGFADASSTGPGSISKYLLNPGESGTATTSVIYAQPGTYAVDFELDGTNAVKESDETNNYLSKTIVIAAPDTTVSEQVKCIFSDSTAMQKCYSGKGSCEGTESCVVDVTGTKGEQVTWKSTCGGYAYTTMDGQSEYAKFACATTTCIDSDDGQNYYVKGTVNYPGQAFTDFCTQGAAGATVHEYYCTSSGIVGTSESYCANGCVDGACVPATLSNYQQFSSNSIIVYGASAASQDYSYCLGELKAKWPSDATKPDSEVTAADKTVNNLVLLGSPTINKLVAELAAAGKTADISYWMNNLKDKYLVQIIKDAFATGKDAVIIAGYDASRSKDACNYVLADNPPTTWNDDKSVKVIYPNGDESWTIGNSYTITWTTTNLNAPQCAVDLYKSGVDSPVKNIVASYQSASYPWTIPGDLPDGSYKILVRCAETGGYTTYIDMSDSYFSIKGSQAGCTDSDGGKNYNVKGTATQYSFSESATSKIAEGVEGTVGSHKIKVDIVSDANSAYITVDGGVSTKVTNNAKYIIYGVEIYVNAINYVSKGVSSVTVTVNSGILTKTSKTDYCYSTPAHPDWTSPDGSGPYLNEYFCNGNSIEAEGFTCPSGCKDGVCLKETKPLKIADISGAQTKYLPSGSVSLTVKGIENDGSPAASDEGYNIQYYIYDANDPSKALQEYIPTGNYNAKFDGSYWHVDFKAPKKSSDYFVEITLYCSKENSKCWKENKDAEDKKKVYFAVDSSAEPAVKLTTGIKEGWNLVSLLNFGPYNKGASCKASDFKSIYSYFPLEKVYGSYQFKGNDFKSELSGLSTADQNLLDKYKDPANSGYLASTALNSVWIYSQSSCELKAEYPSDSGLGSILNEAAKNKFKLAKGWNFFTVLPEMKGKKAIEVSGECKIPDKGIYVYSSDANAWDSATDRIFSDEDIGRGILIKVQSDCVFGGKTAVTPPPLPEIQK